MNDALVEWVNDKEKAQESCSNRHIEGAQQRNEQGTAKQSWEEIAQRGKCSAGAAAAQSAKRYSQLDQLYSAAATFTHPLHVPQCFYCLNRPTLSRCRAPNSTTAPLTHSSHPFMSSYSKHAAPTDLQTASYQCPSFIA